MLESILGSLASKGLNLIASAVIAKGKDFMEDKLGITLSEDMTPEQVQVLRQYELENQKQLIDYSLARDANDLKRSEQAYSDTANARQLYQTAMTTGSKSYQYFTQAMAGGLVGFSLVYIVCITFLKVPPDNVRFADTCLGFILGSALSTIIQFFFGSSRGNQYHREEQQLMKVEDLTGGR